RTQRLQQRQRLGDEGAGERRVGDAEGNHGQEAFGLATFAQEAVHLLIADEVGSLVDEALGSSRLLEDLVLLRVDPAAEFALLLVPGKVEQFAQAEPGLVVVITAAGVSRRGSQRAIR